MKQHMNHQEALRANIGAYIALAGLVLTIIGCYLKNLNIILLPFLVILPSFIYSLYWFRKAVQIDEIYYGQICEQCKEAIADCICMAEIDGAWDDAKN